MKGLSVRSTLYVSAVFLVLAGPSGPVSAQRGGPPRQGPFADLPTTAEMSNQHEMIRQDLAATRMSLEARIQELQELVEGISTGASEFPCASGTPVGTRWVVSESGRTVCDKDTDRVWEQYPTSTNRSAEESLAYCASLGPGWQLPDRATFQSLLDPTSDTCPGLCLPEDQPFSNIDGQIHDVFWSSTPGTDDPQLVFLVNLFDAYWQEFSPDANFRSWCVR